jgi:hypothetical protein
MLTNVFKIALVEKAQEKINYINLFSDKIIFFIHINLT